MQDTANATISAIIEQEWQDFQAVQNVGGRASCQDDRSTFERMRKSQFTGWNEEMRQSYLADLQAAHQQGRNLLSEKYAHMMKYTVPLEYEKIKDSLPKIEESTLQTVRDIVAIGLEWQKEYADKYPRLAGNSRPVDHEDAAMGETTFKNYLRGELLTYSPKTLALYLAHAKDLQAQGRNMSLEIMEQTVKEYGYTSLADAENHLDLQKSSR